MGRRREIPSLERLFAGKRWAEATWFLASPVIGVAAAAFYERDVAIGVALVAVTLFVLVAVPAVYRQSTRIGTRADWLAPLLQGLSLVLNVALVVALSRVFQVWPTVLALLLLFSSFWAGVYASRHA